MTTYEPSPVHVFTKAMRENRIRPLVCCSCDEQIRAGDRFFYSATGAKAAHARCGMMHSEE